MIIAVDFDGTCVKHEYPAIGGLVPYAIETLKELTTNRHDIILWTMRHGNTLYEAINWFEENSIPLYGVNENPHQQSWTYSPKAYAHLYIDDAAFGCPLVVEQNSRPYVDWKTIYDHFKKQGII